MTVPFAVTKEAGNDGEVRLTVSGEIDADVSETLAAIVINAVERDGVTSVTVDLDRARFVTADALHCLLDGHGTALRRGCVLRFVNVQDLTAYVSRVPGLADLLEAFAASHRDVR
jgi:anti-anti-sigma factor